MTSSRSSRFLKLSLSLGLFSCLVLLSVLVVTQSGMAQTSSPVQSSPGVITATSSPGVPFPTSTPTQVEPAETETRSGPSTRTPRPTSTPVVVPPPADPNNIHMMVVFGALVFLVIVGGVWINRQKVF